MKHNFVSKIVMEFLEDLDLSIAVSEIKTDITELSRSVSSVAKKYKIPNWNLLGQ